MLRKHFFAFSLILFITQPAQAQSPDSLIAQGKHLINAAVEKWNVDGMHKARAHFERLLANKHRQALVHYYLGYCDHQLNIFYRHTQAASKENRAAADKFLEDGIQHLEKTIQLEKKFAEAYALLGSLYGEKIGANPLLGMSLGPKSSSFLEKARELAPENPRVAYLDAVGKNFTPAMFGGGKDKAVNGLQEAAELFAKWQSSDPLAPDWGHAECYAWLGQILHEQKKPVEARAAFDKALELRKDYGWVKYELLPKLEAATK